MTGRVFTLPDLGEGLTDAEIVHWLVVVGDRVAVDQPVVEVETAKATVEVPCPHAGVVTELHGEPGDTIKVGAALVTIGEPVAQGGPAEPSDPDSADDGGSGNVLVGYGTSTRRPRRRPGPGRRSAAPAALATQPAVISPPVRFLARRHGIDLRTLLGSGPDGLILRDDVERAIQATSPPAAELDPTDERIPLRGVRRTVVERLSRSRREIPEADVWVDVDAHELLAVRESVNAADPDHPVSVLAMLARFCVLGLRRFPWLNSSVDVDREEIVLHQRIDLGFAAHTDRGLVVPVVHDATDLSIRQLSARIRALTDGARAGTLTPADLTGGTFTVNNYGVFGVDGSAAIINHPEVAIVGIGRIVDRPWASDGQLAVRKVAVLTLSFDHRVCDGSTAGGFLRFVANCVENPTAQFGCL